MKQTYWVFFDSLLKTQTEALSFDEAQRAIFKILPQELNRYFLWTTGWENWQNLAVYLSSDQKNFISAVQVDEKTVADSSSNQETVNYSSEPALEPVKVTDVAEPVAEQFTQPGIDLEISKIKKPEVDFSTLKTAKMKKRASRYDLQLEVLLITRKGVEFRSKSVNISVSGVLLADEIPLIYLKEPFDFLVLNKMTKDPLRSRVKINAKSIGKFSKKNRHQLKFVNPTEDQIISLKSLLDEYLGLERHPKAIYTKVG